MYCSQFHPRIDTIVVTGGYDQVIRIWDISGEEPHGDVSATNYYLTIFILIDNPTHIHRISMELTILYFTGVASQKMYVK